MGNFLHNAMSLSRASVGWRAPERASGEWVCFQVQVTTGMGEWRETVSIVSA